LVYGNLHVQQDDPSSSDPVDFVTWSRALPGVWARQAATLDGME
jgi:hypothetical protein